MQQYHYDKCECVNAHWLVEIAFALVVATPTPRFKGPTSSFQSLHLRFTHSITFQAGATQESEYRILTNQLHILITIHWTALEQSEEV
jgi:hypothetical protein